MRRCFVVATMAFVVLAGAQARAGAQFVLWIRTAAGIDVRAPGEVLQADPSRLLRWRGRSAGISATATWRLNAQGAQTRLTHVFAGSGWMMLLSTLTGHAPRIARKRLENLMRLIEVDK